MRNTSFILAVNPISNYSYIAKDGIVKVKLENDVKEQNFLTKVQLYYDE